MLEEGTPGKWSLLATHPKYFGAIAELYATTGAADAKRSRSAANSTSVGLSGVISGSGGRYDSAGGTGSRGATKGIDGIVRRLATQLQAQFAMDASRLLLVEPPALASRQHVNPPMAVARSRLAALLDLRLQHGLPRATRFVVAGRRVDQQPPVGPPNRHAPLALDRVLP